MGAPFAARVLARYLFGYSRVSHGVLGVLYIPLFLGAVGNVDTGSQGKHFTLLAVSRIIFVEDDKGKRLEMEICTVCPWNGVFDVRCYLCR